MLACDCLVQDFVPEPSSWWVPSCNMGRGRYARPLLKHRTARHQDLQWNMSPLVHTGAIMFAHRACRTWIVPLNMLDMHISGMPCDYTNGRCVRGSSRPMGDVCGEVGHGP